MSTVENLEAFTAARNKALLEFDLAWIGAHMAQAHKRKIEDVEVLLIICHKLRYECSALPRDARLKSATYLRKNKYTRWLGTPLLPHGELPE